MNDCWLLTGDCREMLGCVKEKSVNVVVTSPPYLGLRSYQLQPTVWGGDPLCEHLWKSRAYYTEQSAAGSSSETFSEAGASNAEPLKQARWREDATCERCNAWTGCLGLEPSFHQYVSNIVEVFRHIHRVLRDDGLLFLNLGDTYARDRRKGQHKPGQSGPKNAGTYDAGAGRASACLDLPAKNLIGIPWRVALALQEDGWILRSDIIWAKGNPLPESVTDRPTRSHEYVFMFSKQQRYHYDSDAIREPMVKGSAGSKFHTGKTGITSGSRVSTAERGDNPMGRNRRTVWQINTRSFKGAHFATFPPDLVEPCIKAATSEGGCCFACGTPTVRVIERGEPDAAWQSKCGADSKGGYQRKATKDFASAKAQDASAVKARILAGMVEKKTVGYKAACKCYDQFYRDLPQARSERQRLQREITGDWWKRASRRLLDPKWPTRPAVALDPFAGSGTVGLVARQQKCRSILIEQSEEYGQLIRDRLGLE